MDQTLFRRIERLAGRSAANSIRRMPWTKEDLSYLTESELLTVEGLGLSGVRRLRKAITMICQVGPFPNRNVDDISPKDLLAVGNWPSILDALASEEERRRVSSMMNLLMEYRSCRLSKGRMQWSVNLEGDKNRYTVISYASLSPNQIREAVEDRMGKPVIIVKPCPNREGTILIDITKGPRRGDCNEDRDNRQAS